ncbi:MAG: dihydrolipoamide acetyltransferase family protein, partial [Candidatus Dormibacteraceae bacterium]
PDDRAGGRLLAASPKARRLATERGVEVGEVSGSGPGGAVIAADVLGLEPDGTRLESGRLWRLMARHTAESWSTAPHFYLTREVSATALLAWREVSRASGAPVTFSDLLVKLVAGALRAHPRVNARWRDGLVGQSDINVGLAVATEGGLVVPVIHRADKLAIDRIAARRMELVERARAGRLSPEDLGGGTFTISNLGMYGVDAFTAILNSGQGAILAVGRISDRVVAVAGRPEVRPSMVLSLGCDHRVIDGARGAEFLQTVAAAIEEPPRDN